MAPRSVDHCFLCNRSKNNCKENGVTGLFALFCLPKANTPDNIELRLSWLAAIVKIMPEGWTIPPNDFKVCSAHFNPYDLYESSGRLYYFKEENKVVIPEIYLAPVKADDAISQKHQPLASIASKNIVSSTQAVNNRKRRSNEPSGSQCPRKIIPKCLNVSSLDLQDRPARTVPKGDNQDSPPIACPVMTVLDLRAAIMQARIDVDYRNRMHLLTPSRRGIASSLNQKEKLLLSWANRNSDHELVSPGYFFIFNEVIQMRESLKLQVEKSQSLLEMHKSNLELKTKLTKSKKDTEDAIVKLHERGLKIDEMSAEIKELRNLAKATQEALYSSNKKIERKDLSNKQIKAALKNLRAKCQRHECTIDQVKCLSVVSLLSPASSDP